MNKIAFITDFDGTISLDDFFWFAVDKYVKTVAEKYWQEYLDKKITHFEALSKIFGSIREKEEVFNHDVDNFPLEEHFEDVAKLCFENNIPAYICSAGADYYIERLVGDTIKKYNVKLIANKSTYNEQEGLKFLEPDADSPFHDPKYGVSKVTLVNNLKKDGYFCIFAGDGLPDFEAAKASDIVFARKRLLQKCNENGIKTEKFEKYKDILVFLEKFLKNFQKNS